MFQKTTNYLYVDEFSKYGITTAFTTKKAGDIGIYSPNSNKTEAKNNLNNILKELRLENKKIIMANQTHSTNVLNIDNDTDLSIEYTDIDGFATDREDVVLVCFFADCLPIYIYDKKNKVIGLSHSGWRGAFDEMIIKTINNMKVNYSSSNEDILIALGVGISAKNYEVDKNFYDKFNNKFSKEVLHNVFTIENNKYFFDNTKLNENLALKCGIIKENIIKSEIDVIEANCHSYRRDKNLSGRSVAIISM